MADQQETDAELHAQAVEDHDDDMNRAGGDLRVLGVEILGELREATTAVLRANARLDTLEESQPVPKEQFDARTRKLSVRTWAAIAISIVCAVSLGIGTQQVLANRQRVSIQQDALRDACAIVNAKAVRPLHNLLVLIRSGSTRTPALPGITQEQIAALEAARDQANREIYDPGIAATEDVDCSSLASGG